MWRGVRVVSVLPPVHSGRDSVDLVDSYDCIQSLFVVFVNPFRESSFVTADSIGGV